MVKGILIAIFSLVSICLSAQDKPVIAVIDFIGSGISEQERQIIVDLVSNNIVKSGLYRVIDRMQRDIILNELAFSLSGVSDERDQLEIGKILQAKKIIVGSLGKVSTLYVINIRIVEVETGGIFSSISKEYVSIEALVKDIGNLTVALLGVQDLQKTQVEESRIAQETDFNKGEKSTQNSTDSSIVLQKMTKNQILSISIGNGAFGVNTDITDDYDVPTGGYFELLDNDGTLYHQVSGVNLQHFYNGMLITVGYDFRFSSNFWLGAWTSFQSISEDEINLQGVPESFIWGGNSMKIFDIDGNLISLVELESFVKSLLIVGLSCSFGDRINGSSLSIDLGYDTSKRVTIKGGVYLFQFFAKLAYIFSLEQRWKKGNGGSIEFGYSFPIK